MGMKMKVDSATVVEGPLYEIFGEDEMIVTFNCSVMVEKDGEMLFHKLLYRGHFVDEEGFNRCSHSRAQAQELVNRIYDAGLVIDTEHWTA
jgi:hypothetical protein